jgi:uncharacterized protein (TIGR02271 family)
MDRTDQQYTIAEGTDVVNTAGDKVGEVAAAQPDHIVVEKGFFPTDYYIPMNAIANYDGDKVYLNVTKDAALDQGWDQALAGETARTDVDFGATAGTEGERLRVPVHEEELTATKRERELGKVRVDKDVVAEERVLNVPVTEERVRVERHAVDRETTPGEGAFEQGTIEVPIYGEDVEVQKRARVTEEVEIEKEAVQRTEEVAGTVRHEEVRVDKVEDATGPTSG